MTFPLKYVIVTVKMNYLNNITEGEFFMQNNDILDTLVSSLSQLRRIYTTATVDDFGDVVIGEKTYPCFFEDILNEIAKLESMITTFQKGDRE